MESKLTNAELNRLAAEAEGVCRHEWVMQDMAFYRCEKCGISEIEEDALNKLNPLYADSMDSAIAWADRMMMTWSKASLGSTSLMFIALPDGRKGEYYYTDNNHATALVTAGLKALGVKLCHT